METKHTIVIEARIDIDDVIKALTFLKRESGVTPPSRGAFLKMCVQGIASMNEVEEPSRTTEEKLHLLQATFGGTVNLGKFKLGRIPANPSISRAIVQESISDEDSLVRKMKDFMEVKERK